MKIEVLIPLHAMKEIAHYSDSGVTKIPVTPSVKNNIMPEFLAYAQKYIAENGFKLLNGEQDKLYIYKE